MLAALGMLVFGVMSEFVPAGPYLLVSVVTMMICCDAALRCACCQMPLSLSFALFFYVLCFFSNVWEAGRSKLNMPEEGAYYVRLRAGETINMMVWWSFPTVACHIDSLIPRIHFWYCFIGVQSFDELTHYTAYTHTIISCAQVWMLGLGGFIDASTQGAAMCWLDLTAKTLATILV